jgi:predicted kinase
VRGDDDEAVPVVGDPGVDERMPDEVLERAGALITPLRPLPGLLGKRHATVEAEKAVDRPDAAQAHPPLHSRQPDDAGVSVLCDSPLHSRLSRGWRMARPRRRSYAAGVPAYHERFGAPGLRLPLLVVVSGVPGGGKTTLARRLADELFLPHLNRDLIRDGLVMTTGRFPADRAWDVWMTTLQSLLGAGCSCVVDQTMYAGTSDVTFRRDVAHHVLLVNVHVVAANARERFVRKIAADPRTLDGDVDRLAARWDAIEAQVAEPMDFGGAQLVVDTTDPTFPIGPLARRVWDEVVHLNAGS